MKFTLARNLQGKSMPGMPVTISVGPAEGRSDYRCPANCALVYPVDPESIPLLVEKRLVLDSQRSDKAFVCACLGSVASEGSFPDVLERHLSTWGSNCGAPLAVYRGHLEKLLEAHAGYVGMTVNEPPRDEPVAALRLTRDLAIIDLEGTSLDVAESRIVEWACTVLKPNGSRSRWAKRFNPGIPIPPSATEVHGIRDIDVAGCPPFKDFAAKIQKGLEGKDIGGYNLRSYDLPVMEAEYARAGLKLDIAGSAIIDIFGIYQKLDPRDLAAAVRKYCGREHDGAHGAQADCDATLSVLEGQIETHLELAGMSVEDLAKFSVRGDIEPVDLAGKIGRQADGALVYLFGKHRGCTVESEIGFAKWVISKDFAESTKDVLRAELTRLGL